MMITWQTVAQYLSLSENDMKYINKDEKKEDRSPPEMEGQIWF